MGRSEFTFTHAVDTNPQAQKMSLVCSCTFNETSTRRLQQILNFPGKHKKNTSGSYSSLRNRIRLKLDQAILQPRRFTDSSIDLGFEACTLFYLGIDVRYTYVSVGVTMQPHCTTSKTGMR